MILKVNYNKKTHLINTQDKPTFDELKKSIAQTFKSLSLRYALSYIDEDGDQISLQSQQDYQALLSSLQKTIKINIKEVNQDFVEYTQKIDIQEKIDEIKKSVEEAQPRKQKVDQIQKNMDSSIVEIDQSIIQEKLKTMMPDIVSKIKSQISQEMTQRSRLSDQPIVIQESSSIKQVQKSFSKGKVYQSLNESDKPLVLHQGVRCDNCQQLNITGIRYKCSVCADYDFCEECQAFVQHPHSFLKIKHPKQAPFKIFTIIKDQEEKLELNGKKVEAPQGFQQLVNQGFNIISNILDKNNDNQSGCTFRNVCNQTTAQTEMKPQKTQVQKKEVSEAQVMKPKIEEKVEAKQQTVHIKTKSEEKTSSQADEKKVVANANYLASFGFQFNKCYQWSRVYHTVSKEELLEFCLDQTEFLK